MVRSAESIARACAWRSKPPLEPPGNRNDVLLLSHKESGERAMQPVRTRALSGLRPPHSRLSVLPGLHSRRGRVAAIPTVAPERWPGDPPQSFAVCGDAALFLCS